MSKLIKGIHHVALKCASDSEFERVETFYGEILGLRVARRWEGGVMFDTGSGVIEVFNAGDTRLPQGVICHFALATDDVDACVRAVTEAGYEVFTEPRDVTIPSEPPLSIRMAFCHGPLGEEIEFFTEK